MPIRPYLGSRVFAPELTDSMAEAFEVICDFLYIKGTADGPAMRGIAEAVIEAAEAGKTDADELLEAAFGILAVEIAIRHRSPSG